MNWRTWWSRLWTDMLEGHATQLDHYDAPEPAPAPRRYPTTGLPVSVGDKIRGVDVRGEPAIIVVDAISLGVAYGCDVETWRLRRVPVATIDRIYNESATPGPVTDVRTRSTIDGEERPTVRMQKANKA